MVETKGLSFQRTGFKAGNAGEFEAIVSAYDVVDSYGERVKSGAFDKSMARYAQNGKRFKVLWSHNMERPIGTAELESLAPGDERLPEEIRMTGGLLARAQLAIDDVPDAAMALGAMRSGIIDEFSIGFQVPNNGRVMADDGIMDLVEIDLFEISPVVVGANRQTGLLALKSGVVGVSNHAELVEALIDDYIDHMTKHADMKIQTKAGKVFSNSNYAAMQGVAGTLKRALKELNRLLALAQPSGAKGVPKAAMKAHLKAKGII